MEISEFIPPPIGNMTYLDFSILYHVHLIEKKEDADEQEGSDQDILDEEKVYQKTIIPDLPLLWLKLKPNQEIFYHDIITLISEGTSLILGLNAL